MIIKNKGSQVWLFLNRTIQKNWKLVGSLTSPKIEQILKTGMRNLNNLKISKEDTMFILQAPPNSHPFVWRVYFNTYFLVRIPRLVCVRGMFNIFVGKNCRICQLYWCFHLSICSKTRQRDLAKLSTASQKRPVKRWHGLMSPTKLHVFVGSTRHQKMGMYMI